MDIGHYPRRLMKKISSLPLFAALLLSPLGSMIAAESTSAPRVKKVLEKFRAVRPGARELRLFELDWRRHWPRRKSGRCCCWWCATARATCAAATAEQTPRT